MSMHLHHPSLSLNGKKRGKVKFKSAEAKRAVEMLKEIVTNTDQISIKWDGEVALFFGRDARGQFFVSDKYMYPKGIQAHSIQDWVSYDQTKKSGQVRPDL